MTESLDIKRLAIQILDDTLEVYMKQATKKLVLKAMKEYGKQLVLQRRDRRTNKPTIRYKYE